MHFAGRLMGLIILQRRMATWTVGGFQKRRPQGHGLARAIYSHELLTVRVRAAGVFLRNDSPVAGF